MTLFGGGGKKGEEKKAEQVETVVEKVETELDRLTRKLNQSAAALSEIETKASENGEQERGLRNRIIDLDRLIPTLTTLPEIEDAVKEHEEAARKFKALQIYQEHVRQVLEAARTRVRETEEAITNVHRRVTWIKEHGIPHSEGNIASSKRQLGEAEKQAQWRKDEITTEEAQIRRFKEEAKLLTGEEL